MSWFILGLFCGLLQSLGDAATKQAGQRYDPRLIAFVGSATTFLCFLPLLLARGFLVTDWLQFLSSTLIVVSINLVASVLYIKSLSSSELSLSLPLTKLTPVFILVTGPIVNAEWPSAWGALGVVLSILGTYSLNYSKKSEGIWQPFLQLWVNRGTRRMLVVAMLWAVSSPFDKEAVLASSPATYLVCSAALSSLLQALLLWLNPVARKQTSLAAVLYLSPRALLFAGAALLQMSAILLAPVAYILCLKRSSVFWGILWGKIFFGENIHKERMVGAILTFIGMLVILFGG